MATLDVAGRTLKESLGKGRNQVHPSGRLIATDFGLIPEANHAGASPERHPRNRAASPNSCRRVSDGINAIAPEEAVRGRKHVEVEHQIFSEDSKRQLGKIGVKKVGVQQQTGLMRPTTAPAARKAPGVERMRLCTAEQQAARRLAKVSATHSELNDVIRRGVEKGGDVLVELEKKIQRHLLLEEAKKHERAKTPEGGRSRSSDLGRSSLVKAPFALDNGAASTASVGNKLSQRRTFHTNESRAESVPQTARFSKKRVPNHESHHDVPFDTVLVSETYPEPPVVGTVHHVPHGKGHVEFEPPRKNIDEELQKKAMARCRFSKNRTAETVDASRHTEETPSRPSSRATTLRETQEARCKRTEEHNLTARRGKTVSNEKYRATALW